LLKRLYLPVFHLKAIMFAKLAALLERLSDTGLETIGPDIHFTDDELARLQQVRPAPALDDQTWKDLLVGEHLRQLAPQTSLFGQQELYRRLRSGTDGEERAARLGRVQALVDDPVQLAQLQTAARCLRRADTDIAAQLYDAPPAAMPWWVGLTWLLPLAMIAFGALALLVTPLAWGGALAVAYVLLSTQMRYQARLEEWARSLHAIQLVLRASSLLGLRSEAQASEFAAIGGRAAVLKRRLAPLKLAALVPGMEAYPDWFWLDNVNRYFRSRALVGEQQDFLRDCFERCASLDADMAIARHLRAASVYCRPAPCEARELALDGAVHPLLPQARPLTLSLEERGAFISGQNGVGKSTLLRTVGLNMVMARAFGFCHAKAARLPHLPVYASMQGEDALLGGESLYMAELRRASEMLAAANGPHPGVFFIDEIFRGTNHLESVSAATAVIEALAAKGMVLVSSHNLVLAPLLAHRLVPWCVQRGADGQLTLRPGVLEQTNGIALLARRGLGERIEANAGKVYDWLSAYLAHPADVVPVLV
jgi:hypothetical protein